MKKYVPLVYLIPYTKDKQYPVRCTELLNLFEFSLTSLNGTNTTKTRSELNRR